MKNVLNHKKALFWICIAIIVVLIAAVALYFILQSENIRWQKSDSNIEGVSIKILSVEEGASPGFTIEWTNESEETVNYGDSYDIYKKVNGEWKSLGGSDSLLMGYMLKPGGKGETKNTFPGVEFTEPGKYRIESEISIPEQKILGKKVWVDFYLTKDITDLHEYISWQRSNSDDRGIALQICAIGETSENSYINIKWINKTNEDFAFGNAYYIYKEIDGKWEPCGYAGGWDMNAWVIPAEGSFLKQYDLENFDLSEPGKYKFESTLDNEGKEKIRVEFYLKEGLKINKIHESYRYDGEVFEVSE